MAKKHIGNIRIDDEGAGAWGSQKDESAVEWLRRVPAFLRVGSL